MSKATKLPGLKNIPASTEPELRGSLQAMKEALAVRLGQEGDPLDRAITLRELIDSGMAKKLTNKNFDPNTTTTDFVGAKDDPVDLSIPPAPTGLEASGAFTEIIINWNPPAYGGHAFTEVFRSRDDAVGTAQLVTTTEAAITVDTVGYNQEYYYWVRFVNISGVRGPFNQTNGVKATTAVDIGEVLSQLSETLADLPGYSTLTGLIDAGTLVIRASSAPSTRTDGSSLQVDDIWLDTDDDQLYVRNSSNNAWVKARDGTLKADIDSLVASLNTSNSRNDTTLSAAITAERVVRVTEEAANATNISSLTSTVNGVSANVTTVENAITNGTSAQAGFGIAVNANNAIAGMYLMADSSNNLQNNTSTSNIIFEADQVTIRNPHGNDIVPFTVLSSTDASGNAAGVYIDTAFIKDGAITNALIANATIEAAKITSLNADVINAGTVDAQYLDADVIVSSDLSSNTSTVIHGGNITTGTIGASFIDTAILRATDVGSGGSTVIDGGRIDTGTIDAERISTTNLILPAAGGSTTISFSQNNNQNRFICSVGSGAGFYQGFVKFTGGTNHVKSLGFYFIDSSATSGSGSGFDVDLDASSTGSNTNDTNTPLAGKSVSSKAIYPSSNAVPSSAETDTVKTSGYGLRPFVLSHGVGFGSQGQLSNRRSTNENDDRLFSGHESVNIPITFTYTGSNSVNLFVRGQADSASGNNCDVEARFIKFGTS
tara:strand:+ start:5277 stop:7427 length:2151 start_codon:yes stop_codon:yes gene_type:complete